MEAHGWTTRALFVLLRRGRRARPWWRRDRFSSRRGNGIHCWSSAQRPGQYRPEGELDGGACGDPLVVVAETPLADEDGNDADMLAQGGESVEAQPDRIEAAGAPPHLLERDLSPGVPRRSMRAASDTRLVDIGMPRLSDSMEEATILSWLKRRATTSPAAEPLV